MECLGTILSRYNFIAHQKVGLACRAGAAIRGTSGTPRRTKLTRYRCSLPGLAGFAGNRRTEPEVPPIGVAEKFIPAPLAKSSTARYCVKGGTNAENSDGDRDFSAAGAAAMEQARRRDPQKLPNRLHGHVELVCPSLGRRDRIALQRRARLGHGDCCLHALVVDGR